jgi:sulfide dehydrogenase (flavoprotein) subunit SudB (EC 1.97.-.-)
MYKIIKKEKLNDVTELIEVYAPYVARKCQAGQFIIVRVGEDGERIPLTIADYNRQKETITIIYQIIGYTTKCLSVLNEGEYLTDFVGPLGVPTKFGNVKHVIGVAGGVGSAPLYPQLRALAEKGIKV